MANCDDFTSDEFGTYTQNAIAWAHAALGSTEYRFRCLGFVEDAYEKGNGIEVFGGDTAKESADEYGAVANKGPIPLGAFVFYDYVADWGGECKNWGHVGLYIGDGNVIHSWDRIRIDNYRAVEKLTTPAGFGQPSYIGWAPVERVMKGARRR